MRTERDKMLAGELYNAIDPDLVAARAQALDLCQTIARIPDAEQRPYLLRLFGKVGNDVVVQPTFYCDYGSHIELGDRVFFNYNCVILDVCRVTIGNFCLFGPGVHIYTATHPMDPMLRREQEMGKPVTIGDDVWVGGGAIICPGVAIGRRTVIGAGSVVTRDIPEGVFAAGNPCRVIRPLSDEELKRAHTEEA